jgi:ABC-2 type transport system ATP-binding protein
MNILEFNDIHRAYTRGHDVLAGVTFSVKPGEVVGLLGKNGAGKTTLIRIAMGMLETQQGSVRVFGTDPRSRPVEVKRRIGYVSEDQILPPFLRIGDVIDLHRRVFPTWDERMERQLRDRFQLSRGKRIKTLSKGQARQVALLCAVSHRPEVLLLDEPAGGLDPHARREFLETSIQLLNEAGTTILFSSHHMTDVERLAARVVMLHDGRVLIDNDLDQLRESFSLALIAPHPNGRSERIRALEGCLCVRQRPDALHAIFQLEPDRTRDMLERELGLTDTCCTTIPLEEMFIELVGGQG